MLKKPPADRGSRNPYALDVGRRLAQARAAAGLTQAELARRLGISASRLSNWENGIHLLPGEFIPKIFLITRVDSDWLLLNDADKLPANIHGKLFPSTPVPPKKKRSSV